MLPIQNVRTRFQITLEVQDKPGVLASVANEFGSHGVSVETVTQSAAGAGVAAQLTIMTHSALERDLESLVESLTKNDFVVQVDSVIRVEGI